MSIDMRNRLWHAFGEAWPTLPGARADAGGRGSRVRTSAVEELDGLLEAGAARTRLIGAEAEVIREAILDPAPALSARWWERFHARLTAVIVEVSVMPDAARAAL